MTKFQTTSVVYVGFLQFPRLHLRIISPWQALPFRANGHLSIQRMDFLCDFSTVSSYVPRILQYVIFHTQLLGQRSKLWQLLDKASVSPKTSTFAQCLSTGWQCFGKLTCTWARRQSIELWQERRHLLAPSKSSGQEIIWKQFESHCWKMPLNHLPQQRHHITIPFSNVQLTQMTIKGRNLHVISTVTSTKQYPREEVKGQNAWYAINRVRR